jgi:hypothetical protein
MKHVVMLCAGIATVCSLQATPQAASQRAAAAPIKAVGSVDLKDPAGDLEPISTSGGSRAPVDVVLLSVRSDGTRLTIAATIAGPDLGSFATGVVKVLFDTDNDPATGVKPFRETAGGYEFLAELALCMTYENKATACAGGINAKVADRFGAVTLRRLKGDEFNGDTIVDAMGFGKKSPRVPVTTNVVECAIEYGDLGVKPGQTIGLYARETGGSPKAGTGAFATVVLTLK